MCDYKDVSLLIAILTVVGLIVFFTLMDLARDRLRAWLRKRNHPE